MRLCRCIRDDRRGVALIEFALSIPILVVLFAGGYQICDAVSAYRKVTTATRTIADLTSQYTTVNTSDLNNILNSSQQVMAPYPPANAKMTVSQVNIDASGKGSIDWSEGKNTPRLQPGSPYNVPASIRQANTSLIVAKMTYAYNPVVARSVIGPLSLTETIIMSPRASPSVFRQ
jgi:Flp pilus assembly protein TadG